jgi:hypothetical protein
MDWYQQSVCVCAEALSAYIGKGGKEKARLGTQINEAQNE